MGRGQQMSSVVVEKPNGISTLKAADSMRNTAMQRRLVVVALFAAFLPFLITRSYTYYMSSDVSTEAEGFFEGQPAADSSLTNIPEVQPDNANAETESGSSEDKTSSLVKDKEGDTHAYAEATDMVTGEPALINNTAKLVKDGNSTALNSTKGEVEANSSTNNTALNSTKGEVEANSSTNNTALNSTKGEVEANSSTNNTALNSTKGEVEANSSTNNTTQESKTPKAVSSGDGNSVIVMETPDNTTHSGACDLVKGKWVPDARPPDYTNETCRFIQGHQNCMKNGRPDVGYLHWKWQPDQCDLPRINAKSFLKAMQDRSMVFAGDSIARNQFQSLLCLLSQVEDPKNIYHTEDDRDNVHLFPTYNFTLAIYWSPYLVHVEDKMMTWPADNKTERVAHIHVDKLDDAWVNRISGVDFLQLSTGQWWFKRGLFLEKGKALGGHVCDGWEGCVKEIGFADPYRMAVHNILEGSLSAAGYKGVTVFRTFGPDHFEDGRWDTGGKCARTSPGGVPVSFLTEWMYGIQKEQFLNVTGEVKSSSKDRLKLLDITYLANIRADGHPNSYREFQPFGKDHKKPIQNDCLHWCLPGPIDTWNDLLVESLRNEIYR